MLKFLALLTAALAAGIGLLIYRIQKIPDLPRIDLEQWWGSGPKAKEEDKTIRTFKIEFNDTMIEDLKNRLRNRRPYTKPLEGMQSEYGMSTIYLEKVVKYWLEDYNFKERANRLNKLPHYKTKIQGLDIHFIRLKPEAREGLTVVPLLLLHGWPSSSREFFDIIPMLATPNNKYNFVFDVVAADLPGYGYSEGTNKPGLSPVQMGIIMRNLMRQIGFNKFYIQAGDWGSQAATHMCTLFPNEILGFHSNMPISSRRISNIKYLFASFFPSLVVDNKYKDRISPLKNILSYLARESGYFHLQVAKPDTIGAALVDTPAGLAAYIMEVMGTCSNRDQLHTPHGGLDNLKIDDVLDTITILWATDHITTSMRTYAEAFTWPESNVLHNIPTTVPTAVINFLHEIMYQPDWILRDKFYNLVRSTTLDFGGHFAAMHTPDVLVDDIFQSVAEFLKFHASKN